MSALGTFLINLLGSVFGFFVTYLGKRLALVLSVISFLAGLAAALFTTLFSLLTAIQYSLSEHWLSYAVSLFWPVHLTVCISVYFSALITRWVYDRSTFYVGLFWESAGR